MKKILLSIALIAIGVASKAQTIKEDTVVNYTYASIAPEKIFPNTATRIRLIHRGDNLEKNPMRAQAVIHYWLMTEDSKVLFDADITIEKGEYIKWDANSLESTYDMVCNMLNLTIVD